MRNSCARVVERCKATVRSDELKRWAKDAPTCLQSLIRLDVCGEDAAVGLSESFDVDFGAKSDGTGKQGDRLSVGGFRRGRSSRWHSGSRPFSELPVRGRSLPVRLCRLADPEQKRSGR